MEVDEKPTETYTDIGGLDKQIQEVGHEQHGVPSLSFSLSAIANPQCCPWPLPNF